MGRVVQRWIPKNGSFVKIGSPPRPILSQKATKQLPISISAFTGGTEVAPLPYPTYTDYPVRKWEDIDRQYSARNLNSWSELPNMSTVLRSLTSPCYVELPEGFRGKIVDFVSGGTPYGVYAPNCLGLWGKGPGKAVIWLQPMSSTKATFIPQQTAGQTSLGNGTDGESNPYTLMRLGPNGSKSGLAVHNYGWALCGTDQPNQQNGEPHNYSGFLNYWSRNSTDDWLTITGIPGDWNSPPGETFAYAHYMGFNPRARFIEVDGYNVAGVATGGNPTDFTGTGGRQVGSAVGNNGVINSLYEDLYCHDTYVGGPTVSGAGGPDGTVCQSPTFIRMRSHRNANHGPHAGQLGDGKTFGGFNVEGTLGLLTLDQPDFRMSGVSQYQKEHLSLCNMLGDLQVTVNEPRWDSPLFGNTSGWVGATNGAFVFKLPDYYPKDGILNTQKTPPKIVVKGVQLQYVHRYRGQGWPSGVNPATHAIWVH